MMVLQKIVSACFSTLGCQTQLLIVHSGGPGPEIAIAVDSFPGGTLVRVMVSVTTPGGQSSFFTVFYNSTGSYVY